MDILIKKMKANLDLDAIAYNHHVLKFSWLCNAIDRWLGELPNYGISKGSVVAICSDYTPNSIAILIALAKIKCIIVPITNKNSSAIDDYCKISQAEYIINFSLDDDVTISFLKSCVDDPLLLKIRRNHRTGLILFSSGSTGKSKAVIHDFELLFKKHEKPKRRTRVIAFLLFDHIGGLNTLFYTLFNLGCLVITQARTPHGVCDVIKKFNAEALTTTPTFLNLLLLSDIDNSSLKSLQYINYGTEIMPEWLLLKLRTLLPKARFSQAYGLSEVGVLPARSKSSDSLFIKIDGDGFQTRVVDGLLEIKADSSMLGYINEENPFTNDGWFKTGDAVEVDGRYIRILGRQSDLINVGGVKVYPVEVEEVIQQIDGVEQVSVYSNRNAITGQIVVAKVKLKSTEPSIEFKRKLQKYCQSKLQRYKIPQKIIFTTDNLHNERFKTIRK